MELGKKINEDLSKKIRKHTGRQDRKEIASIHNIDEHKIKSVLYMEHCVNSVSLKPMQELLKRAIANSETSAKDHEFLKGYCNGLTF